MSPRSEEFMEQARERLDDAQKIAGLMHPAVLVSAAHYAMLNAARAALSERGESAVLVRPASFGNRIYL